MGNIKLLDQETINQIAAGEVVDRPASIVKELLENAIDAGAGIVTVEIKDGGISLIRITDNGSGIAKEDIRTAFLRHSTSKIRSFNDLTVVSSLGFRGEALSSIAAISQVELITKTKDAMVGTRYVIEGGEEKRFEDVGAPDGTTFIIKNVFFNTPARRKFLKSSQTEAGYIANVVEHIALSHPEVSIRFVNNGQGKVHTPGNNNLLDVIYSIYGKDTANNVINVDAKGNRMTLKGYIGKPVLNKGNRTFESYYINGRYIKSNIISKAIEEAYKPYLMQHKYPFTNLHFEIDSELIDVNVHPAKMEIRFRNTEDIYGFIVEVVSEALKEKPLIPDVRIDSDKIEISNIIKNKEEKLPEPFETNRMKAGEQIISEDISYTSAGSIKELTTVVSDVNDNKSYDTTSSEYNKLIEEVPKSSITNNVSEQKVVNNSENLNLFTDNFLSETARKKHKIIGQIFDTYWIVEYDEKMFIIDQHAAHEKVMYENLIEKLKNKTVTSQLLSPPTIISLSMSEEELLRKCMDTFTDIGFQIEHFGGREYAVRAVPLDLYSLNDKDLLMNIIDNIQEDNINLSSDLLLDKIASMACKAAVKGNSKMSLAEANELIDRLLTLDNPYNCPHGRPTIISMTKYEIEKKFKRIV